MNRGDCWFEAVQNNDLSFGSRDEQGNTALMIAASNKFCQLVDELARWEFGYKNNLGQTALMLAAISGCAHCVRALQNYEAGQLTHQGKTALMMAVFNGNIPAAKELLYSEFHIGEGEHSVDNYLEQAIKSKKGDIGELQQFKQQLGQIRQNIMYPFIQTAFRRLDEQETLLYRAYAMGLKAEGEQRQRELFKGPVESPGGLGTSFGSNRPPVRLAQISPAHSGNTSMRSYTQKSFNGKNDNIGNRSGIGQVANAVPTSALRKQQEELSRLMDSLKTDIGRLQRKQNSLESDVKNRLPGNQMLDTAMQKSLDAELRIQSLQNSLDELKARTDKAIEHQAAFGNTVMQMLGSIVKKIPNSGTDASMSSQKG